MDPPEDRVQRLDAICRRGDGVSRAEVVRRAVAACPDAQCLSELRDVFGIWAERNPDGLQYERRYRREW